jgi:uncharacterized protein
MNESIKLNDEVSIDLPKLIDSRLLVQANSGGGKSWLLRRILEQSHGKVQQIVIDLEGEFSTLREKHDYILAGKGGDVPAESKSAGLLARKILELNVSAIIDLYELPHYERKHFVKLFLDAMVNAPKELWHSCMVVLDEAHVFVPEKGESEASESVIDLCTRGRKRGYCAVLATQRLSKLHKDAAAECNNKLIGRTGLDIDMKRAAEELGFTSKDQFLSLRSLEPGEFFAYGPAISKEVIKVTVGPVSTHHPVAGSRIISQTIPPTEKIKSVLKKLTDLPQEAEKELRTIAEFKAEVTQLRRDLTLAKKTNPAAPTTKIERIEIPAVGKRTLEKLKVAESNMRRMLKAMKEYVPIVETSVNKFSADLAKVINQRPTFNSVPVKAISMQAPVISGHGSNPVAISNPEQRILDAIAWMNSIGITEPEQTAISFLAGYSYGGGAFNNPRGALRVKGLVGYLGNRIKLTPSGSMQARYPEEVLTIQELQRRVLERLPGPEKKLLEVLLAIYPESTTNEELAARAGYAPNGGAYNNPRGRLRTLGLIEYLGGGQVKAKSLLFLE